MKPQLLNMVRHTDENGWRWYINQDTQEKYLSVTLILSLPVPQGLVDWFKNNGPAHIKKRSKETSELGTRIHTMVEMDLNGELRQVPEDLIQVYENWVTIKQQYRIKPIETEFMIAHPMGFAGQADALVSMQFIPTILDIKTGSESESAFLQTGAYREGIEFMTGMTGWQTAVVYLNRDGDWSKTKVVIRNSVEVKQDFEDFKAVFQVFKRFYKQQLQGATV